MCLAVPGKITEITKTDEGSGPLAVVDMQGNRVEASLVLTPEAAVGDWVLLHAGFAIQVLDEQDARETWEYLQAVLGPEEQSVAEKPDP
jgi:hydrogenase expression/formation protein HypC